MCEEIDYSIILWAWIDKSSWEIVYIESERNDIIKKVQSIIESSYSQDDIHRVQQITWPLWEDMVCKLFWCKKNKNKNHKWHDATLKDWTQVEVKVGRIWNSAVIKRNQLEIIDENSYYILVYYRTTNNLPPTHFMANSKSISWWEYLKRNMFFESIFVFPKKYIIYFYNTSKVKEGTIKWTWKKHKPICKKNALSLFLETNIWNFEKKVSDIKIWRHNIKCYSIGLEI